MKGPEVETLESLKGGLIVLVGHNAAYYNGGRTYSCTEVSLGLADGRVIELGSCNCCGGIAAVEQQVGNTEPGVVRA